jgi:hypothetical protein
MVRIPPINFGTLNLWLRNLTIGNKPHAIKKANKNGTKRGKIY